MATSLADIRARLAATETKSTTFVGDKAIFSHWNIPENSTTVVRFLPDGNPKNDFFWIERQIIKLPFAGVKGQADSKPVWVQVPCMEMWNETCPVLAEVRPWYKDESLKEMANKYWKKRSYLFQGFVRTNTLKDDETPENPIRRFIISPSIFNIVKSAIMDPELEEMPTDFQRGLDFKITKTKKGDYADYGTSAYVRKESALTTEEAAAIEQFGLYNLSDFLPKKPGAAELACIKEMFEASVDGQPYDMERWGQYYKPAGMRGSDTVVDDDATPKASVRPALAAVKTAPAPVVSSESVEEDVSEATAPVTKPAGSSQRAEDILAMIRNRSKK
jgi:hypothetical protein